MQLAGVDRHLDQVILRLRELKAKLGVLCGEFQQREVGNSPASAHSAPGPLIAPAAAALSAAVIANRTAASITVLAFSIVARGRP